MLTKIETMRKKSKEVRDRYAFWVAFLVTIIIASFWIMSLPTQLSVFTTDTKIAEKEIIQGGFSRSFSSLQASLYKSIQVEKVKSLFKKDTPDTQDKSLDFNNFFATTSPVLDDDGILKPTKQAQKILIGTTSEKSTTSILQE